MKPFPVKIIKLIIPALVLIILASCNKDTDLLAEYIVTDKLEANLIGSLVKDDFFVSKNNGPINLDVLANDGFENPSKVRIIAISRPSKGNVVLNPDNTLTYTPGTPEPETLGNKPPIIVEPSDSGSTSDKGGSPSVGVDPKDENVATENSGVDPKPKPKPKPGQTTDVDDSFTYTTETENEDNTTTVETGTVEIKKELDYGELKAFPTAYGAGSHAVGGRGGSVYHVTNLNNSGAGSFRDAVKKGNRTIVFDVSGTIELTENLYISVDNLTIAGQTAPLGGITITGKMVQFQWMNNLILRYVRFRPYWTLGEIYDAVSFSRVTNSIIDHVSVSWGGDEALSLDGADNKTKVFATYNVTVQRTLMGESTKGSIIGYSGWRNKTPYGTTGGDFSVNQNMYVNISHRFPGISTQDRIDVINNVVHNWRRLILGSTVATNMELNAIGNYWQRGCIRNVIKNKQVGRMDHDGVHLAQIHSKGNIINGEYTDPNASPNIIWQYWKNAPADGEKLGTVDDRFFRKSPFPQLGHAFQAKSAEEALKDVTGNVGANMVLDENGNKIESIDFIDERYIKLVKNNICESYTFPPDPREYTHYQEFQKRVSNKPINIRPAGFDTDGDGMPDAWELSQGLDPNDRTDGAKDSNGDGYTNLENYLNLVDF